MAELSEPMVELEVDVCFLPKKLGETDEQRAQRTQAAEICLRSEFAKSRGQVSGKAKAKAKAKPKT
jgi:hypothetical protein